jgi:DNA modification methylase
MVENIEDFDINSILKKYSTKNEIKINPEYEKLVHSQSKSEFERLKNSIKETGLHLPIIINQDSVILDGHQRYRACSELGLDPTVQIKEFSDPISEKEFVIVINLTRRQLKPFQISELGFKLEEIEREKARIRQLKPLKNVSDVSISLAPFGANEEEEEKKGKVSKIIANKIGQSTRTYERNRKIINEGSDEQIKGLRNGRISTNKVYNEILKAQKRKELLFSLSNNSKPYVLSSTSFSSQTYDNTNPLNLIEGDFSERGKEIPSESIDLIFTDRPYSSESINIYSELVALANRVLKPGCSFVTYLGSHNLSQILEAARSNNLHFWWIIAVKHNGSFRAFHQRKVRVLWKPLLWFVKGEKLTPYSPLAVHNNYLEDYVESKPPDKVLHPWQQSTVEAEYVIKNLTLVNQIVLDPLMGSGTTGLATINLGRKFIGIEKDKENFTITKKRLEDKLESSTTITPTDNDQNANLKGAEV